MGSKHETLHDLVLHQLRDLYYAERHMAKTLLKLAKAASSDTIKTALVQRHDEVSLHVDRLEACFAALDKKAHGVPCEAMDGIIAEAKDLIHDFDEGPALDAGLVGAAEAMEHYAVARYTALSRWAPLADLAQALAPVETTLSEARAALERWASLGSTTVSPDAPMSLKQAALVGLR